MGDKREPIELPDYMGKPRKSKNPQSGYDNDGSRKQKIPKNKYKIKAGNAKGSKTILKGKAKKYELLRPATQDYNPYKII